MLPTGDHDAQRGEGSRPDVPQTGRVLTLLGSIVALAVVLRLLRLPYAWSAWSLDFVEWSFNHWSMLSDGSTRLGWTALVGLHPPQWHIGVAVLMSAGVGQIGLQATSVVVSLVGLSIGVGWFLAMGSRGAAVLFGVVWAVSPLQVWYSLEISNYALYQASGAALLVSAWYAMQTGDEPKRWVLAAVGLATALALHSHFGSTALVGAVGLVVLARKRWRLAGAMAFGTVLAVPVLLAGFGQLGAENTFHNEAIPVAALPGQLIAAWEQRFIGGVPLAGLTAATVVSAGAAVRDRDGRPDALLLVCALAAVGGSTLVGIASGAAFYVQTQYWVLASWLSFSLLALGFARSALPTRAVVLLLTLVWLVPAAQRAVTPGQHITADVPDGVTATASDLRAWLDTEFRDGDLVVYIFDGFDLDTPQRWDPLFAAFRPGEFASFSGQGRLFGDTGRQFRTGELGVKRGTVRPGDSPGDDLIRALETLLREDRRLLLIIPLRRSRDPHDLEGLRREMEARGASWRLVERGGLGRVTVARRSAGVDR